MPQKKPLSALSTADRQIISDLYAQCTLTRDDLPYTDEFDTLHLKFCIQSGLQMTRHDFWRACSSIGKMKGLKRKAR